MKVNLPCRDIARLVSDAEDRVLPASDQARLRLHFVMCRNCRTLEEEMSFLRRAMRQIDQQGSPPK
jgi:hypothetical protein